MGVAEDFSTFRDNYIVPSETVTSISYRYKRITRQLNTDFWGTNSETAHSLYVGSYGRNTAAKGISDLDIAFRLPPNLYLAYDAHSSNGQSGLLQAIKRSIQNTYRTSDTFGDGQVVVITFMDNIRFEILPVFDNKIGTWTYPNANGGGSWKICDPKSEIAAIEARNKETNNNLRCLCQMMRIWANYCDVPITGMLIDTLAYQFIENWPHKDKSFLYHDFLARDFFDYLSQSDPNQSHWRAPGSASYVERTGRFEYKARSAYLRATEAILHDKSNEAWSRRQKWRVVFGPTFPAT